MTHDITHTERTHCPTCGVERACPHAGEEIMELREENGRLEDRIAELEEMLLDIADGAHYDSEYHSKKAYLSEDTYDALLKMRDEREARLRGKS